MSHSIYRKLYPLVVGVAFSLAPVAAAQVPTFTNINTTLANVIGILQTLLLVFFGIAIVVFSWGIVKYITAAGDPAKLKEARSFIIWGIIFITILVLIFGIVSFLRDALNLEQAPSAIRPPSLPTTPGFGP